MLVPPPLPEPPIKLLEPQSSPTTGEMAARMPGGGDDNENDNDLVLPRLVHIVPGAPRARVALIMTRCIIFCDEKTDAAVPSYFLPGQKMDDAPVPSRLSLSSLSPFLSIVEGSHTHGQSSGRMTMDGEDPKSNGCGMRRTDDEHCAIVFVLVKRKSSLLYNIEEGE